jgi:DNA transformation protein
MPDKRDHFVEILELLEPFGDITGRALFGGFGFWDHGEMFALIGSNGTLYFKADETTVARYHKARAKQFNPHMANGRSMNMPYWSVPAVVIKDESRLAEWVAEAIAVGHATAKKRSKKRVP